MSLWLPVDLFKTLNLFAARVLNQLLVFCFLSFKLILTSPVLWSFSVFCFRLLTLWDIAETLKCLLAQGSQTHTPLTLLPEPWGNGHKLPGKKAQEAWANQLLKCPPHRWSARERLLPAFFWEKGTASIMAFESKRHFLCLAGFPSCPAAPSWSWQHFPSIWQEKIIKGKTIFPRFLPSGIIKYLRESRAYIFLIPGKIDESVHQFPTY